MLAVNALVPLAIALALSAGCKKSQETDEDAGFDAGEWDAGIDVEAGPDARDAKADEERAMWADAGRFCGDAGGGQPDCPMQGWMKKHATTMLGFGDLSSIGEVFDQIVKLAPDDRLEDGGPVYTNWRSISEDGAAAARAGDIPAAKAACRGCHVQYLHKYRDELRGRPLPPGP